MHDPQMQDPAPVKRVRNRDRKRSKRQLTPVRRLGYRLLVPIGIGLLRFFWATCRIARVEGGAALERRLQGGKPVIFCYWHRHQILSFSYLIRSLMARGVKIGWLISASVDGQVPSDIARRIGGGIVFRGSTTAGGAQAMRAMYKALARDNICIAATPDGPSGPASVFKPGVIKLAQLTGAPLVPIAWAVKHALVLKTWDRFVVPRPFSPAVLTVGDPVEVPRDLDDATLERLQRDMEARLQALYKQARDLVEP